MSKALLFWGLCVLGGALATAIHIPSGWMIGSMLTSIAINLKFSEAPFDPLMRQPMNLSQTTIALLAAYPCSQSRLSDLASALPLAVITTVISAISCYLVANIMFRKTRIDWTTSFISLLPGGASTMFALATELKADAAYVAFTQYLRVIFISLSIPLVALFFGGNANSETVANQQFGNSWSWFMIVLAFMIGLGAKKAIPKLPAPFMIPAVLVASVFAISFPEYMPRVPNIARDFAYIYLGATAGAKMNRAALLQFWHCLHWILLASGLIIGIMSICAVVMYFTYFSSALDAYLATVPGAIYIVFGFAAESENGGVIVMMQIVRVLSMITIAGFVPWIVMWRNKRHNQSSH